MDTSSEQDQTQNPRSFWSRLSFGRSNATPVKEESEHMSLDSESPSGSHSSPLATYNALIQSGAPAAFSAELAPRSTALERFGYWKLQTKERAYKELLLFHEFFFDKKFRPMDPNGCPAKLAQGVTLALVLGGVMGNIQVLPQISRLAKLEFPNARMKRQILLGFYGRMIVRPVLSFSVFLIALSILRCIFF